VSRDELGQACHPTSTVEPQHAIRFQENIAACGNPLLASLGHPPFLCNDDLKMRGLLAAAFWLCVSELSVAASVKTFETVETSNGRITGHHPVKAKEVWEYLGIPYAAPPLGDLRFAAPQKYKGNGFYNASTFVSTSHRLSKQFG
jgi:hypothetical protein